MCILLTSLDSHKSQRKFWLLNNFLRFLTLYQLVNCPADLCVCELVRLDRIWLRNAAEIRIFFIKLLIFSSLFGNHAVDREIPVILQVTWHTFQKSFGIAELWNGEYHRSAKSPKGDIPSFARTSIENNQMPNAIMFSGELKAIKYILTHSN